MQGVGGAAMFATTFALINASYTGRDRGVAYGVFGAVSGGASALGPVVGGLLTQGISWRWIFFVNVPISIVTIALTLAVVPAVTRRVGRRIDLAGIATFTVAAGALTFALIRSSTDGWSSPLVLGLFAVTVLGAAGFITAEARTHQPLIELSLFGEPRFAATVLAALVLSFSAFGVLIYTTVWVQTLLGLSPIEAGLVSLPLPVLVAFISPFSGRFMHLLPRSLAIGGGVTLIGLGGLISAWLVTPQAGWVALIPGLALMGIGCALSVPTLSRTATEAVGDARSGMAAGAINTARQLGQAIGIALLGSLAAAQASTVLRSGAAPDPTTTSTALLGGQAQSVLAAAPTDQRPRLDQLLHAAFASSLDLAFMVTGIAAVVAGVLVAVMLRTPARDAASSTDAPEAAAADAIRLGAGRR
ncbi:MFS transporter [Actinomycetospora endophytica]|uniref:MFS transporter n=1 Tax=Actinomycetospora endophytica TaxID=2291215 RepID=UPI0027E225CC|nr:MFS transporter [Actinomycetospora endophytica]